MEICQATSEFHLASLRQLFAEYAAELGIDLAFQGFAAEVAGLPGAYCPPRGRLLLAMAEDRPAGCIALRPFTQEHCEMKRLYVRPGFRGQGLGRRLAERIVDEARRIGYARMVLDTLPQLGSAMRLYESLGFQRCQAYYETPLCETTFMELCLA